MPERSTGHPLGALGVAVATAGLGLAAGPLGVAAGLSAGIAWYLLPAAYAFAVGQLLAVVVLSADAGLAAVAAIEVGLLAVLAGPLATTGEPTNTLAAFAVAAGTFGAVGWSVLRTGRPPWLAVLAVAVVAATAAYGVHRYERVSLGLVDEERAREPGGTKRGPVPGDAREEVR